MEMDAKASVGIDIEGSTQNREDDIINRSDNAPGVPSTISDGTGYTSNQPLLTGAQNNVDIGNQPVEEARNAEGIVVGLDSVLCPNRSFLSMIGLSNACVIIVAGIILTNIFENFEIWETLKHVPMLRILIATLPALLSNPRDRLVTCLQPTNDNTINTRDNLMMATMIVAFVISTFLILFDFLTNENFSWANASVLVCSYMSIVPMSRAVTEAVLWLMKCFHVNSNNQITLITSTICDIVSMLLLLLTATLLLNISTNRWFIFVAPIACLVVLAACTVKVIQKSDEKSLITTSWVPLLVTLFIYCAARQLLGKESSKLNRFMDLHQIYSGINGYLFSAKIVDKLHKIAEQIEGGIVTQNEIIRGSWKQYLLLVLKITLKLTVMPLPAHIVVIPLTNFFQTKRLTFGLLEVFCIGFSAIDLAIKIILALITFRVMLKLNIDRDNWKLCLVPLSDIFCMFEVMALLPRLPQDGNL